MNGVAVPAGELLPQGFFGTTPGAEAEKYDPDGAKKLLAEAGYPDGFGLTLGPPNDRYIHDAQVSQAVAQMLTRLGIETEVDAVTASTFFQRLTAHEFYMPHAGRGAATGEMSDRKAVVEGSSRSVGVGLGGRQTI